MTTKTTEVIARVTGDASGAVKAYQDTVAAAREAARATQEAGRAAQNEGQKTVKSFEATADQARKAAAGVTGVTQALYGLQAEGSSRVLALSGAVGNLAEMFGPGGALVTGVGVAVGAITAIFLQAQEKSQEYVRQAQADLDRLASSSDLAGINQRQRQLFSGDEFFPAASPKASAEEQRRARAIRDLGGILGLEREIERLRNAPQTTDRNAAGQNATGVTNANTTRLRELLVTYKDLTAEYAKGEKIQERILSRVVAQNENGVQAARLERERAESAKSREQLEGRIAELRRQAADKSVSLAGLDAFQKATVDIETWRAAAEKAGLSAQEVEATVGQLYATLGQARAIKAANEALEENARGADAAAKLQKLLAENSGSAIAQLNQRYDELTDTITKLADAAEKSASEEDKATAARARAAIPAIEKQRAGLVELAKQQERVNAARRIEATFAEQADANYRGEAVTIADRNRAAQQLLDVERELQELIAGSAQDSPVRAAAEQLLADLRSKGAETAIATATASLTAADATERMGAGIRDSAQAALSLVQLLGQGSSELAQQLASITGIGSGIQALGALAGQAGGFGALFGSVGGIASALGPVGAIAGGAIALAGTFMGQSEAEKRREEELRRATEEFNASLAAFIREIAEQAVSGFTRERNDLAERIGERVQKAAEASGFDPSTLEGVRQSSQGLRAYQESLRQLAATAKDREAQNGLLMFSYRIGLVADEAEKAEQALAARQAQQLRESTEDLRVRALIAAGRSEEAEALRRQLEAQRAVLQAQEDYAGAEGYQEYLRALAEVIEAERVAAEAARTRARVLNELDDTLAVLGGSSQDRLRATIEALGKLFPELAALGDGLDLGSEGGLTGLRDALRAQFTALLEGGITEAEQPIVDAIRRILDAIGGALADLPDTLQASLDTFQVRVDVFGLSLREQILGLADIFAEAFPDLADTLQGADLGTSAGRAGLRDFLLGEIDAILADGQITSEEAPYLQALRQFLGLVDGLISDAATELENDAAEALALREAQRARAGNRVQLFDLEGTAALSETIAGYGDAFSALFENFDLATIEGIGAAKSVIRGVFEELDGLTDEQLLERFGLTRDEIVAALLDTDNGLDSLAGTLRTVAQAAADFETEIGQEFLRSTGNDRQADLNDAITRRDNRIAKALELGLGDAVLEQIEAIYQADVRSIEARFASAQSSQSQPAASALRGAVTARVRPRSTSVVGDFGGLSEVTGQSLAGLLREVAINTGERGAIVRAVLGGIGPASLDSLRFPSFPSGGAGSGTMISIGQITVQVGAVGSGDGPAEETGRRIAETVAKELGRLAIAEARFLGSNTA